MDWRAYFERNRGDRAGIPWEDGISVEPHLRAPLIASLQRFQVGEQGDGAHLQRVAATTGDHEYLAAIRLFIAEEQEHARLLARLLALLNAPLLTRHWSDGCFVLMRRIAGLRLELLVLLSAELIARPYYNALRNGTRDHVLQSVCAQILRDEAGHVAFQCDSLRRWFAPLPIVLQRIVRPAWWLFFQIVCLIVIWDHRAVLRAVGVPSAAFWRDCNCGFDTAAAQIFDPLPVIRSVPSK